MYEGIAVSPRPASGEFHNLTKAQGPQEVRYVIDTWLIISLIHIAQVAWHVSAMASNIQAFIIIISQKTMLE